MRIAVPMLLAIVAPGAAAAQIDPVATPNDPGLRDLNYSQAQQMRLPVARGGALNVTLADDEAVQSISTGAPASWKVTVGASAYTFIVRAMAGATDSTLSVLSNKHTYNFVLTSVAPTRAPYLVRMTYMQAPASIVGSQTQAEPIHGQYRVYGNAELRPEAITDDGSKTYIEWGADQAIPAVFSLDRLNREEMVNGYMRDDIFTIDRVYDRLVFRIDRAEATAKRRLIGKPR